MKLIAIYEYNLLIGLIHYIPQLLLPEALSRVSK